MTRPAQLTDHEYYMLPSPGQRRAYDAEWAAWWQTPEGQAERAEREAREKARYDALLPAAIERVLRDGVGPLHIGLPPRALDIVLAGLAETPAVAAVKGCTDIVVLLSPPGTGKTVAGCERVREYIATPRNWTPRTDYDDEHRRSVPHFVGLLPVWTTAAALARLDHFSDAALKPYMQAPLLVIDDLGAEYLDAKGFFGSLFDELLDARYAGKLPTVITTNLDAAAFASRYGLRVVDRIREAGRFINCGNTSLRGRAST